MAEGETYISSTVSNQWYDGYQRKSIRLAVSCHQITRCVKYITAAVIFVVLQKSNEEQGTAPSAVSILTGYVLLTVVIEIVGLGTDRFEERLKQQRFLFNTLSGGDNLQFFQDHITNLSSFHMFYWLNVLDSCIIVACLAWGLSEELVNTRISTFFIANAVVMSALLLLELLSLAIKIMTNGLPCGVVPRERMLTQLDLFGGYNVGPVTYYHITLLGFIWGINDFAQRKGLNLRKEYE